VSGPGEGPGSGSPSLLPRLANLLLGEETIAGLLDIIVNLAASSVIGVDGASVSMVMGGGHRLETTNSSSELVREIDQAQYKESAGPCVEAIRTASEVAIAFPTDLWPFFSHRAMAAGTRSVLSLPLMVKERSTGALNLYSMSVTALEAPMVDASRRLAAEAAFVLANAAAVMSTELVNQHLEQALATRDMIGQAKGVLMARHGVSAEEAFTILRQSSQASHRKLHDVAAEVVAELRRPPGPS
jgi:hypothetical protein